MGRSTDTDNSNQQDRKALIDGGSGDGADFEAGPAIQAITSHETLNLSLRFVSMWSNQAVMTVAGPFGAGLPLEQNSLCFVKNRNSEED